MRHYGKAIIVVMAVLFISSLRIVAAFDGKPVDHATYNAFRVFYDYDRDVSLDVRAEEARVGPTDGAPEHRRISLSFMNNRDERVPALLWLPTDVSGRVACVFFLHGLGGSKQSALPFAMELLQQGYAVMALDAAYHGERAAGKVPMYGTTFYRLRDGYMQTVVDYRRALDYLETRSDIDASRVTLIGVSMGGIMGAILGGLRLASSVRCCWWLERTAD